MDVIGYDEDRRPYLSLWAAGVTALLAALIGAGAVAAWHVSASAGTASSTACVRAMSRAEAALADARVLEKSLATQTQAMNDLVSGRVTAQQALDRTLPGLTRGSQQSMQFDQDRTVYANAEKKCRSG